VNQAIFEERIPKTPLAVREKAFARGDLFRSRDARADFLSGLDACVGKHHGARCHVGAGPAGADAVLLLARRAARWHGSKPHRLRARVSREGVMASGAAVLRAAGPVRSGRAASGTRIGASSLYSARGGSEGTALRRNRWGFSAPGHPPAANARDARLRSGAVPRFAGSRRHRPRPRPRPEGEWPASGCDLGTLGGEWRRGYARPGDRHRGFAPLCSPPRPARQSLRSQQQFTTFVWGKVPLQEFRAPPNRRESGLHRPRTRRVWSSLLRRP